VQIAGQIDIVAPGAARVLSAPDRFRQSIRFETVDERAEPALAALEKCPRERESGRDQQDRGERARAFGVAEDDRFSSGTRRALGHEREQPRTHAGHVRRDQHRGFATYVFESDPRACQGAFVLDIVTRERNAIRAVRERQLRPAGREHDDDVVARTEKRTERPVEERRAVDRLEDLRSTKSSGGSAREKDPGRSAHPREISTTAL